MENDHDLTTKKGFEEAKSLLKNYGWIINPLGWAIYKVLSAEPTIEAQSKLASDIIKAGKENGAKKIKMKIANKAGFKLGISIEGIPLKMNIINDSFMELEVEY